MDQDTIRALADLRYELGLLKSALGADSAEDAEVKTIKLRQQVQELYEWAKKQGMLCTEENYGTSIVVSGLPQS